MIQLATFSFLCLTRNQEKYQSLGTSILTFSFLLKTPKVLANWNVLRQAIDTLTSAHKNA